VRYKEFKYGVQDVRFVGCLCSPGQQPTFSPTNESLHLCSALPEVRTLTQVFLLLMPLPFSHPTLHLHFEKLGREKTYILAPTMGQMLGEVLSGNPSH